MKGRQPTRDVSTTANEYRKGGIDELSGWQQVLITHPSLPKVGWVNLVSICGKIIWF
jgi:hypothetical protein